MELKTSWIMIRFHVLLLNVVSLIFTIVFMITLSIMWLMVRGPFTQQYKLKSFITYASLFEFPYGKMGMIKYCIYVYFT